MAQDLSPSRPWPGDGAPVAWVVEDSGVVDSYYAGDTAGRAYRSAVFTLSLGVLGSSVLPLPFAICKTGILLGCITMAVVAWTNVATSCMLIRASACTGRHTYEGLAEWAGGRSWKAVTQVALLLLLWGTLCGGLALLSDVAVVMAEQAFPGGEAPAWLNGRVLMTALALLVLFPLCLQRHMRQLEAAATAGVALVLCLVGLLGARAVVAGFPAIADGEVPLWSMTPDKHLPEAFSVLAYAFYMQPMMMTLLPEMPAGRIGVEVMRRAVGTTLYGVAFLIYAAMGLFGASLFGRSTEGNIMVNKLVDGRVATFTLYGGMLLYLALGMTTTQYALRQSLDLLVLGEQNPPFTRRRQVALTSLSIGSALCVALIAPSAAEKIISVVGATGVCMVSYVIPVAIQITGHQRRWRHPDDEMAHEAAARYYAWHQGGDLAAGPAGLTSPLLDAPIGSDVLSPVSSSAAAEPFSPDRSTLASPGRQGAQTAAAWGPQPRLKDGDEESGDGCFGRLCSTWEGMVKPLVVLVVGAGFSVAALYVAVAPFVEEARHGR